MKKTFNKKNFILLPIAGTAAFLFLFFLGLADKQGANYYKASEMSFIDTHLTQRNFRKGEPVYSESKKVSRMTASVANSLPGCNLELNEIYEPEAIGKGGSITYTANIKNKGLSVCDGSSFTVYYSENETFLYSSPRPTASNYYWSLGDLKPEQEASVSITTAHKASDASTQIYNESCATANNGEDSCAISVIMISQEKDTSSSSSSSSSVSSVSMSSSSSSQPPYIGQSKEFGSWVWVSPTKMSLAQMKNIVISAYDNGINALYITIDDYLDVNNLPDGINKETKKKEYSAALENFVRLANEKGIAVDAEAGDRNWAEPSNRYKAFTLIDFAINYNKNRVENKLRNFQYDVEPYLLAAYERNKAQILKNFVEFIDQTAEMMKTSNIGLSVVIPHFYDSSQKWTPAFVYGGEKNYAYNHLLKILDKMPESSIIIMSYRNYSEGKNGTVEISNVEVSEASAGGHKAKVIVAQETGNVEPDFVTFYGASRDYFFEQLDIVNSKFKNYPAFGGAAVHYLDTFLELN